MCFASNNWDHTSNHFVLCTCFKVSA